MSGTKGRYAVAYLIFAKLARKDKKYNTGKLENIGQEAFVALKRDFFSSDKDFVNGKRFYSMMAPKRMSRTPYKQVLPHYSSVLVTRSKRYNHVI